MSEIARSPAQLGDSLFIPLFHKSIHRNLAIRAKTALTCVKQNFNV